MISYTISWVMLIIYKILALFILKEIAFALFLMDGDNANVAKLDQRKRISISKLDKIFQVGVIIRIFLGCSMFYISVDGT